MTQDFTAATAIKGYHAHIYYTAETRAAAARLRAGMGARFHAVLGRWHDEPVGPHPIAMYQVAFETAEFERIVPWLMLNRDGLDILVHPMTGDAYLDHSRNALWLGTPQTLRLEVLKRLGAAAA
ncbi:MAG TPA: DOPA 4,5-dioxygenase family protein [Stellaceae bacterium]|nr:DOPA 4,5-dioxygenase family protein [Stellaceae bacterium]